MTASMTWVRGLRSTFELPIFEETHNRALARMGLRVVHHSKIRPSCPLWVKSGHFAWSHRCPLYPQKRTSELSRVTSALYQKQTFCAAVKNVVIRPPRPPERAARAAR